jgi:dUTP pyrophosphatase
MAVHFIKSLPEATIPSRYDSMTYILFSAEGHVLKPGNRAVVSTGIKINLGDDLYGKIASDPGLAVSLGVQALDCIVHNETIKVILFNHGDKAWVIRPGYKIAQLLIGSKISTYSIHS